MPQSDFWPQPIPSKLEMCLEFMNVDQTPNWANSYVVPQAHSTMISQVGILVWVAISSREAS